MPSSGTVADLITLADVKTAIGITGTGRDDVISDAITAASDLIVREYEREFTATASATREFAVVGDWIDLTPYDLRTVTSITLDPDDIATVLAATDYQTHPFPQRDGVATAVELLTTSRPTVTGRLVASIEGAWGFASVPEPVKRACIETVRAITRADPGGWSSMAGTDGRPIEPEPQGTYAIPRSARRWLDPYRRYVSI